MTRTSIFIIISVVLSMTLCFISLLSVKNHFDQRTLVADYTSVHRSVVDDVIKTLETRQKLTAPPPAVDLKPIEERLKKLEAQTTAPTKTEAEAKTVDLDEIQKTCASVVPAGCSFDATPATCHQLEADKDKIDLTDCPAAKERMTTIRCLGKFNADWTEFAVEPHDCYDVPDEGP